MSGPKTSRYTLTAEQRRILAEQQRIERQKAVAIEKIKSKSKRIAEIESIFSDDTLDVQFEAWLFALGKRNELNIWRNSLISKYDKNINGKV